MQRAIIVTYQFCRTKFIVRAITMAMAMAMTMTMVMVMAMAMAIVMVMDMVMVLVIVLRQNCSYSSFQVSGEE